MISSDPLDAAANGEGFAADALAAHGARGRMLVHEQARAGDGARAIELPELAERRRLAARVILKGLGVRSQQATLGIEDAHRVGDNVEDRLELRDAAGEIFTQTFSFGDVVAGEDESAAGFVAERREGRFDEAAAKAVLEGHARRRDRHPADGAVDLIGEIGERVREGVVDRDRCGAIPLHSRQVAIAGVRRDHAQVDVEDRDRERDCLEERVETGAGGGQATRIELEARRVGQRTGGRGVGCREIGRFTALIPAVLSLLRSIGAPSQQTSI